MDPENRVPGLGHHSVLRGLSDETMQPWRADGGYFNFADRPCDTDTILPPEVCSRLAEVKRKWGPDGRLFGNHAVSLDSAV